MSITRIGYGTKCRQIIDLAQGRIAYEFDVLVLVLKRQFEKRNCNVMGGQSKARDLLTAKACLRICRFPSTLIDQRDDSARARIFARRQAFHRCMRFRKIKYAQGLDGGRTS